MTGDLGPWRGYLQLLRLPAVFSAWSNVFAGHLIATMGAGESPRWGLLALQIGIATCLYLGGMVLNDCFDLEEDRIQRPSRPLPSGQVPVPSAWRLGFGLLLAGTALGIVAGGETLWLTLGIAAAVLLYDGVLKAGPLGPLAMGLCRYLNWLMALSAAPLTQVSLVLAAPALIYTGGVTALSRAETGGALVGPLRWTWLALAGTLATMAGLFLAGGLPEPAGLVAVLILVAFVGVRLLRLRPRGEGAGDATLVQAGVRTLLLGMIPLDAALLLGAGLWVPALLLPSLLIPARRLGRWLYLT